MENKYFNKTLLVLMFFISPWFISQTIASSESTALCSACTPNANWTTVSGTPDISNRTTAATVATTGGGATWNSSPLPVLPNNNTYFISLRDIGTVAGEEAIRTTMSGLTVGREYEVLIYTLSATAPGYSPTFIDAFAYQLEGGTRINITQTAATRNTWVTRRLRFIASATTRTLTFYPGSNASTSSFESINISVTANAINAVPIAVNDNVTTLQNTPVTINVAANDTDPNGSVVANTVRFTGGQTSVVTTQGTWSVNTTTGQVTFTPVNGFVGTASIPYTIQDNYTLNGVSSPSTSSNGIISVLVNADTDGDGIANDLDLDDDNDGIPDCDENLFTSSVSSYFQINGNASMLSSNEIRLTPAVNSQAGQAW